MKNQATGHYILNGKGEGSSSRSFIDLGIEWEYNIEEGIETLHTDGPLRDAVVVLVSDATIATLQYFHLWRTELLIFFSFLFKTLCEPFS